MIATRGVRSPDAASSIEITHADPALSNFIGPHCLQHFDASCHSTAIDDSPEVDATSACDPHQVEVISTRSSGSARNVLTHELSGREVLINGSRQVHENFVG
jgi:hypothetical protein